MDIDRSIDPSDDDSLLAQVSAIAHHFAQQLTALGVSVALVYSRVARAEQRLALGLGITRRWMATPPSMLKREQPRDHASRVRVQEKATATPSNLPTSPSNMPTTPNGMPRTPNDRSTIRSITPRTSSDTSSKTERHA